MSDPISDFREAMRRRGLIPPADIKADGKLHRCELEDGKKNNRDGSYLIHLDGRPAGGFQNFKDGLGWEDWLAEAEQPLSADESARRRAQIEADQKARSTDDAKRKKEAAEKAAFIWDHAEPVGPDHGYLVRKGVQANGVRLHKGSLCIPVRNADGMLCSLQFIDPNGGKWFLTGGRKAGCFYLIGEVVDTLVIAEGYATAATIHEATGLPVAIGFDAGNLEPVARELRRKFSDVRIIVAADDDWKTSGNPGLTKAIEAAHAVDGFVAVPLFGPDRGDKHTDFNDQAAAIGTNAVRLAIEGAQPPDTVAAMLAQRADGVVGSIDPAATERGQGEVGGAAAAATSAKRPAAKRGSPFRMGKFGIEKKIETEDGDEWRWFCSPLEILAATRDGRGEAWGRLLQVTDMDGQARTWAMPMSMLAGDGTDYRAHLLFLGLQLAPGLFAKNALHEYLVTTRPDKRVRCVNRVGWHDGPIFVMPDQSFSKPIDGEIGEETIVQTTGALDHAFKVAGDPETWRSSVAALAVGNSRLLLSMATAFAAPLLKILGLESGGIHFTADSSIGKTTLLDAAGSVWGGGGFNNYKRNWKTTDNGLEAVVAAHCDALLALDEMGQANSASVGSIVYMLANGVGKSRAARNGDARPVMEWRTLFLSTGEKAFADTVLEDGKTIRVMGGQQIRIIDLKADAGAGHGAFEELHGHHGGNMLSDALKQGAKANYGHAAREFLSAIVGDLDDVRQSIETVQKDFLRDYCPVGANGQVQRVGSRFALIAAAGELAAKLGIVPWPSGEAVWGCARCFGDWIAARGGIAAQEDIDIVRHIRRFIEANATSRFERIGTYAETEDLKAYAERTLNRVGFRKTKGDEIEYLVMKESWQSDVCRGFDHKNAEKVLLARGMILPDSEGKPYRPHRLPGFPKLVRVVNLTAKLFEDGDDG